MLTWRWATPDLCRTHTKQIGSREHDGNQKMTGGSAHVEAAGGRAGGRCVPPGPRQHVQPEAPAAEVGGWSNWTLPLRRQHTRPGLILSVWIDTCFRFAPLSELFFASSVRSTTAVTASAMLPRSLAHFVRRGCAAQKKKKTASPQFYRGC